MAFCSKTGLDHLGIQAESAGELAALRAQLAQADVSILDQADAACCYAKSDKHWTIDPQGIAWESFHTLESVPTYGDDARTKAKANANEGAQAACCTPA